MISTFGLNSKKYSDLPLTYAPATGFKWRLLSSFLLSSDSAMTVQLALMRNDNGTINILSTTAGQHFDAIQGAQIRYASVDLSSLDTLTIEQTGGSSADNVNAVITVEVLPA